MDNYEEFYKRHESERMTGKLFENVDASLFSYNVAKHTCEKCSVRSNEYRCFSCGNIFTTSYE